MFDRLFKRRAAVAHHTAAPLLLERLRYLRHLQDFGASRGTLVGTAHYMLCLGEMFQWKFPPLVTEQQIDAAADRWIVRQSIKPRRAPGQATKTALASTARSWLRFLGLLQ